MNQNGYEEVDMDGSRQPSVYVVPPKKRSGTVNRHAVGAAAALGTGLLVFFFPEQAGVAVQMLTALPLEQLGDLALRLGLGGFAAATAASFLRLLWERRPWQVLAGSVYGLGSLVWRAAGVFLPETPQKCKTRRPDEPAPAGETHPLDPEELNELDGRLEADFAAFAAALEKTKMKE